MRDKGSGCSAVFSTSGLNASFELTGQNQSHVICLNSLQQDLV